MVTINANLIPTIPPGSIFKRLTTDTTLNVRFLGPTDPALFSVLNRPHADIVVRQLIISKALDQVNLRLGARGLFPFLVPPKLGSGSEFINLPGSIIWDMSVSLPKKWEKVRLARIKRVSGANPGTDTDSYTGKLRFVFTAQEENSTVEVSLFQADLIIDSELTYQVFRISIPTISEESIVIGTGETETIDGFVIFRTLDLEDPEITGFLDFVAPPVSDILPNGEFITPSVFDMLDSLAGGTEVPDDFQALPLSHGTGLLVVSATNPIPRLDSDVLTWVEAFNFPFRQAASRDSVDPVGINIPKGLFIEFDIVGPAGDRPDGDVTGKFFPIWIGRIERIDPNADEITLFFATFNVTDQPSTAPIEFAKLILRRDFAPGRTVEITPTNNLFGVSDEKIKALFLQGFGRGHVVLSSKWGGTGAEVTDFFDSIAQVIGDPAEIFFKRVATTISSFAVSRVPKFAPTAGQAQALVGSRPECPPSKKNRYVVEEDQGLGDEVDFADDERLPPELRQNEDIERIGHTGSLAHRVVSLVLNSSGTKHTYERDVEPRLTILFGRLPKFADMWWDGTRLKFFNGDTWVS